MMKKKTFKEFATCDENVATNLLSSRLKLLESLDIITKRKLSTNKKENIYLLTQKGLDLAPLILEIAVWSDKYVREYNHQMNEYDTHTVDKKLLIHSTQKNYEEFVQQIVE